MKIVHIITGLKTGGAETMLYRLLAGRLSSDPPWAHSVISLTGPGPMGDAIGRLGIGVSAMGMAPGRIDLIKIVGLAARLAKEKPDIIQTWMYHADLLGGIAAKLAGQGPVVWNIRHSNLDRGVNRGHTLWTAKACALLSRLIPARIICNSETGLRLHANFGYSRAKMIVIPNGIDAQDFKPDIHLRDSLRSELGVSADEILIGLVGRFDPQKDHGNFIKAAGIVARKHGNARFLLCGPGISWDNASLSDSIKREELTARFDLLGTRSDIQRVNCGLDIACSSSLGEGFSNSIAEAMACGVPCVVTDVGDSASISGGNGIVVPPGNSGELAKGIASLITSGHGNRAALGALSRSRILEKFDIGRIREVYRNLYESLQTRERTGVN